MTNDHPQPPANHPNRPAFDQAAAAMGISGPDDHLDELYNQLQTVLSAAASLKNIDVTGAEPDLAFIPLPGGGLPGDPSPNEPSHP